MQAVDGKTVHLPQEMVQGLIQTPLHLQLALHIGFPQCQGGAVHQLLHRYGFPDVNGNTGCRDLSGLRGPSILPERDNL